MATATDVARYLVELAAEPGEQADLLTNLRIQKLLYYAQGWHLAMYGSPLFKEAMQAWNLGPVVPDVYRELKRFGRAVIEPAQIGSPESLTESQKLYLQHFWANYQDYSGSRLIRMTHAERPWLDARKGAEPCERSEEEITQQSLRDFFRTQLIPGLEPRDSWEGLEELKTGKTHSHAEVFAGLGSK